ncbi:unnamed protein product [Symbiodinium sp. CCMP2456]|nr:unnamed protein product [Symbiodinium sp. CCMP2456]
MEEDDDGNTQKLIAYLVEQDVRRLDETGKRDKSVSGAVPLARPEQAAPPANSAPSSSSGINGHLGRIEADYIAQMTKLRLELREAELTEERLREDRNIWRQAAEQQEFDQEGDGEDENEDGEEVSPACADPNHEQWIGWLQPAFRPNPDIDGLNDSGHIKFKSIDVKLGVAMTAMIKTGGDNSQDLYLNVSRKANKLMRDQSKMIKGRQIIAMMYESFRTRDRLDMIKAYVEDDEGSECSSVDSDIDSDCSTDDEAVGATLSAKPQENKRVSFAKDFMIDMVADDKPRDRHMYIRVPGTDKVKQIVFFDGEDEIIEMNGKVERDGLATLVSQENGVSFQTANGITATDLISNFRTKSFAETINAYVLEDTPSVLSAGKRRVQQGYGFVGPPGKDPFMINPDGKRISLFVHGDIPYVAQEVRAGPREDEVATSIKAIFYSIGEDGALSNEKMRKVHMTMKLKDLLMMKYQQMKHLVGKYRWQKQEGLQNHLTEDEKLM